MTTKPLIGAHISIAQGVEMAPLRARKQGCEVMQIFVQTPQAYQTPKTSSQEIKKFKIALKKNQIKEVYAHTPYIINLASENNRIRYGSINLIQKNLQRASMLGCKYLMTHIGSYGTSNQKQSMAHVIKALTHILTDYTGSCKLLLELSAGSGHIIGSRFKEIHKISTALKGLKIEVCLDTAHIFASGYDLRGEKAINKTLKKIDRFIGLKNLKLIHLNDTTAPFGSHRDRHTNLGDGLIGLKNFKILINHPKLRQSNFILETPGNARRRLKDINLLKSYRK